MDNVLIIADDAEFTRTVVGRWQTERSVPEFTLVSGELRSAPAQAEYGLAIVGPVSLQRLDPVLAGLEEGRCPAICVAADSSRALEVRAAHPRVLVFRQYDGWADTLVQLGSEVLKRMDVLAQLRHAEQRSAGDRRHATLGRYMLEMRHSFNNALTSVLGNAELLLLEPGAFSAEVRDQIDTIHTMTLRMHEIMQRLASLEAEMNFAEKSSQNETSQPSQAYAGRF